MEELYSFRFPKSFLGFCQQYAARDACQDYPGLSRGSFVSDISNLRQVIAQVGREEWGDYQEAIAGRRHPNAPDVLWGGFLPFYIWPPPKKSPKAARRQARNRRRGGRDEVDVFSDVLGFGAEEPSAVSFWSVHCVVHVYPSFEAWLETMR
ncbi:MAG: hypothetical protein HY319_30720 [Armatimonadetes bacterium]|nr:hypothetical protein [Armatimonadota bacterium]